eukprot:TRINITY_DN47424_c1_g1_i1.p1 TRINITY_DN47424_c1_g1~~TRINITY_DN47424_c1_g1_i1.p1  ORF type:complete len:160 (-),score=25.22 TRINITY_DN47424_c1_g1_i1:22-501(-)
MAPFVAGQGCAKGNGGGDPTPLHFAGAAVCVFVGGGVAIYLAPVATTTSILWGLVYTRTSVSGSAVGAVASLAAGAGGAVGTLVFGPHKEISGKCAFMMSYEDFHGQFFDMVQNNYKVGVDMATKIIELAFDFMTEGKFAAIEEAIKFAWESLKPKSKL